MSKLEDAVIDVDCGECSSFPRDSDRRDPFRCVTNWTA